MDGHRVLTFPWREPHTARIRAISRSQSDDTDRATWQREVQAVGFPAAPNCTLPRAVGGWQRQHEADCRFCRRS